MPRRPKQIREFLGLCSWHKAFTPHFSNIAAPLYHPTKKWDLEEQHAFDQLKTCLTHAPVLALSKEDAALDLYTDASDDGLGAELSQRLSDGTYQVLTYASRILRPPEKNYSATKKECLSLVWACERLRIYLSHPFQVFTDHAALGWIQTKKELKGRLARWAIQLQEYC
ncbi:Retrovirus-related Pol polyprotein from transposon 17.6 [Araneus ventricosus]|uniref:Retrovirus-related Pol polyprotein from transposon 17.6 n=1 Tax=Araneus ventricosus TaxID=182803 RepID=A0A4Y2LE79_ARAVE|nr:Retrovirus-related Pol polyprotein from transposon 17.6 [Araneus ventricosus]GBN13091.1 Retrovirus-related Pol polyprotein from transposon 17.6 [Araneus ventricosus]